MFLSLLTKIQVHNNFSSSEKIPPLLSSHIKIHQHICLDLFFYALICAYLSPNSEEGSRLDSKAAVWH